MDELRELNYQSRNLYQQSPTDKSTFRAAKAQRKKELAKINREIEQTTLITKEKDEKYAQLMAQMKAKVQDLTLARNSLRDAETVLKKEHPDGGYWAIKARYRNMIRGLLSDIDQIKEESDKLIEIPW